MTTWIPKEPKNIAQLAPYAERGLPIVGLEPSSLLTLRDEYLYLLKGDARAEQVTAQAFTFEEFIADLADEGALPRADQAWRGVRCTPPKLCGMR